MIMDRRTQFCAATSVAAAAGTTLIGDQIDLGIAANMDADNLYLVIMVTTAIITAGVAGTLSFSLASDTTAAISTTTSAVHAITGNFVTGATPIAVGSTLAVLQMPRGSGVLPIYRRFLGVLATVGTTAITAGAVNAFLASHSGRWIALPQAVN